MLIERVIINVTTNTISFDIVTVYHDTIYVSNHLR